MLQSDDFHREERRSKLPTIPACRSLLVWFDMLALSRTNPFTETDCLFHFEPDCLSQLLSRRQTNAFRSLQESADVVRINASHPR